MSTDRQQTPSAEQVAAYLRRHPRFLNDYPELAISLNAPRNEAGATSLTGYQLEVLRDKNRELNRRLQELYSIAQENERLTLRTHQLTLALLRADSTLDTLRSLVASLIEQFNSDLVRVLLLGRTNLPNAHWLKQFSGDEAEGGLFEEVLKLGAPLCGRLQSDKLDVLFEEQAKDVQSAALVALPGHGLLAIGSREANHFYPGMGTLFLRMMGESMAAALSRFDRDA
ncbi:MAG TPA: DUF484 family protein [Aquimonas sp.]|nr:DUF484 family protein [Aquimonas sp.]HRF53879.1 DUF484 family protein [Aquimonas sp.]